MLQAKLRVIGKKHHGRLIPLTTSKFLVGREQDCQLRPSSDMVSRHHCALTIDDFSVCLRDLGSTNGTFVNENRVRGQVVLKPGDRIRIGKLVFELVVLDKKATASAGGDAATALPALMKETAGPDTAELSGFETVTDLPVTPKPGDTGTIPAVQAIGAEPDSTSDTSMFFLTTDAPADGNGVEQSVEGDTAVVSQESIAPPASPAGGYPQQQGAGYQNPPGYGQVPQPYQPYPGQYPGQPMAYPTPGMPYPVAPMYPQPPMMYPVQQPQPAPMATPPTPSIPLEEESSKLEELPVLLPDPAETGAKDPEPPPPAPVVEAKDDDDSESEDVLNPSEKAADIIRQHLQRRPDDA